MEGTTGLKSGARDEVVRSYRIDRDVLNKLGDIVSERGDMMEARKLKVGATLTPLTQDEKSWTRAVIKAIIRRKAEYDHDPGISSSLPQITMGGLPKL